MAFLHHEPCPKCGSRNNLARYEDGGAKCFSEGCDYIEKVKTGGDSKQMKNAFVETPEFTETTASSKFITGGSPARIEGRKLSADLCAKWHYHIGQLPSGEKCHIANFLDSKGNVVGQKVRMNGKKFLTLGDTNTLYGKFLYPAGGKYAIITEGELDAISVGAISRKSNFFCPMSIPSGAQSAEKVMRKELKWLESSFERIILMFDNDEPGQAAVEKVSKLFSPGKCYIATLSEKDASDMLVKGKEEELGTAIFQAKPYCPAKIVRGQELTQLARTPKEKGQDLPWPRLNRALYGVRRNELWVLTAGTSAGKTEIIKEFAHHFAVSQNETVGMFMLEEQPERTALSIISKQLNKPIYKYDVKYTEEEFMEAARVTTDTGKFVVYQSEGDLAVDKIIEAIRYMIKIDGCKYIFLDHLTLLVATNADVNTTTHQAITELNQLAQANEVTIFAVVHVNKGREGQQQTAEEGAELNLDRLYGSSGIKQQAHTVLAFERNLQENPGENKHWSKIRVLKHRHAGEAVGTVIDMVYDVSTGRLTEAGYKINMFEDRSEQ